MKTQLITAPLLAGLFLSAALPAFSGITRIWQPASGSWFDQFNWFPNGIPQSGDTVVIDNGGTVNIDQPLNFAGTILWSQGTITSIPTGFTLATNGILEILSGTTKILTCPLQNFGIILLKDNSTLYLDNSSGTAGVVNYGTIQSQSDDRFSFSTTPGGYIVNYGLFQKSGGSGTTSVPGSLGFLSTGTMDAQTGTIEIATSGTLGGSFIGAGVNHWIGNYVLAGTVISSNVLVDANLTGTNVALAGDWTWQTGTWGAGTGNRFTLNTNSLLTLVPGNYKILHGALTNSGTIRLTGNTWLYLDNSNTNAQLVNLSLLDSTGNDQFTFSLTPGGVVDNRGIFTKSGGTGTTTFDSSLLFVSTGPVTVQSGTLSLQNSILTDTTISGPGQTLLTGANTINGDFTAENLEIQSGSYVFSDVRLHGPIQWDTGDFYCETPGSPLTVASNCVLTLVPGNYKILHGALTNSGTIRLTNNTALYFDNGNTNARLVNLGLLDSTGNDLFRFSSTPGGVVDNRGTFTKSGGTGTTTFDSSLLFQNTGAMSVQSGTLSLQNSILTDTTISGPGQTLLTGAHTINGDFTVENLEIQSGSYVFGDVRLHGPIQWDTGDFYCETPGSPLTVASNCVLTLVPGDVKTLYGALTNSGTIRLTNNTALYLNNGNGNTRLVNLNLLDSTGNDLFRFSSTPGGVVDNQGTFTKSGGTGTTTFDSSLLFQNTGAMSVQSGTLSLQNSILTGTTISGPGQTLLTGNHTINGDFTAENLEIQSGSYVFSDVRLHGPIQWDTGNFYCETPGSPLTVASDCVLTLVPGDVKTLYGALTNSGTIRLTNNTALYLNNGNGNTRLVNLNLLDSTGNDLFRFSSTPGGVVDNQGTFTKSGGTGTTTFDSSLLFVNTGPVSVQSGILSLQNSILTDTTISGPGQTLLTGTHTINGDFTAENLEMPSGNFTFNDVRLHGPIQWDTGNFYCETPGSPLTVASDCVLTLVPGNYKFLYGALTNSGTIRLTGNTGLYLNNVNTNTRLVNLNVLDSTGNDQFGFSGTPGGVVDNQATFTKSGGTGTTTFDGNLLFRNTGTVSVQSGTLHLQHSLITSTFNGPGLTLLTGTQTITNDLTAQNMELQSGNFTLDGARLHGTYTWDTGNFYIAAGNGVTLELGSTLTLAPGNYKYLYGTLTNDGAMLLTGNTALYLDNGNGNARLANYGLVESLGDDLFSYSGTTGGVLENHGFWRKSDGTGNTTFGTGLTFIHAGALEAFKGAFLFNGTSLVQQGGTMSFRLNSDANYGQINFTGVAPLGGGIAWQVGPGYSPAVGTHFDVINCAGTNGVFVGYAPDPGYTWSVFTTNTYTRLTVTGANPPGSPAVFSGIEQVAPQALDLHLTVTPNAPYHMEVRDSLDPGSSWTYLGPFSSSTSDYVYHHIAVGNLPPQQFFRAVSP